MLNKLLKRCMPWMDKGRWERLVFNQGEGEGTFVIDMEKSSPDLAHDFDSIVRYDNNKTLTVVLRSDKNIAYQVKDFRASCSSFNGGLDTTDYRCLYMKGAGRVSTSIGSGVLYDYSYDMQTIQLDLFVERVIL